MQDEYSKYIKDLNNGDANIRLDSLRKLMELVNCGEIERPVSGNDVNNHIHTTYSFSPYSPAKAVWMAFKAGLTTAGIMDHDSISGAEEFIEAGKITGIATTTGVECRADFSNTPLKGRRINNPDQESIAYIALHGIPRTRIDEVKSFFAPYVMERNKRNRLMVGKINELLKPFNIRLDFESDILPLSMSREGGSITERHLLFALSHKLVSVHGKGEKLLSFLREKLSLSINPKLEGYLSDIGNSFYEYDLLGVLKSDMVDKFYIEAKAECPDVTEVIRFSNSIGAISAYAYLGDVSNSVTGDKKSQKFEDGYIELLFDTIKELGFNAVTYMPSRNSLEQLRRVKGLCEKHGFFQISGEDINSPRQPFICMAMRNEEFRNLVESTWALIGHERAAARDINEGLFSKTMIGRYPDLSERIRVFAEMGKREVALL